MRAGQVKKVAIHNIALPGYHNNGIGYVIIWITEKEEYVDFMKKYSGYME